MRDAALGILNLARQEEDTPKGARANEEPFYKLRQTIGQKIELPNPALFATDIQTAQVWLREISGFISQ